MPTYVPREVSSLNAIDRWKANEIQSFFAYLWHSCVSIYQSGQVNELFSCFISVICISTSNELPYSTIATVGNLSKKFLSLAENLFGKIKCT